MALLSADYWLILNGLDCLYSANTRAELERATRETLQCLVPADLHEMMIVGAATPEDNLYITTPGSYTAAEFAYVQEHAVQHPVGAIAVEKGDVGPITVSQLMPLNTWREHEFYVESGGRRMHLDYELDATTPGATGSGFAGVAILRSRMDFTDRDRQVVDLLRSHLGRVWGRMMATERMVRRSQTAPSAEALRAVLPVLTRREAEVLAWVCEGKRDGEIALIMGLSAMTVSTHVRNLLAKLGVESRLSGAALSWRRLEPSRGADVWRV